MENTGKDKLITDMKVVLSDVDDLLKSAAAATGDTAAALREKAAGKLKVATEKLSGLQEAARVKGKEAARYTDDYVHAHPWQAVGIAAAAGFLIGLLVNRK
ncbi:YqjD family protein [Polaromonas sp. UC242_47]|uniref:YqjD family protein n=1 Tax=Polaromonas sp. UC242_47 TaxID=3374626 RepID=UPI00379E1D24